MKSGYQPSSSFQRGVKTDSAPKVRINNDIRAKEIRVIDSEGGMLGIMPVRDAVRLAEEKTLDLIEIAPKAKPPVCKIMDYGKFVYEVQKKEKHQRKQQQQQQMKEIRFKPHIQEHDFNFKTRHARGFIEDGNKVKATVMFRGREMAHKDFGKDVIERFVEALSDIAKMDSPIKTEGRFISVVMAPGKQTKKN